MREIAIFANDVQQVELRPGDDTVWMTQRQLKHYNLNTIISFGYLVNFTRATRFRHWANRVLREYLTRGYSLNDYRLAQQRLSELEQAVDLLAKTLVRQELASELLRWGEIANDPA